MARSDDDWDELTERTRQRKQTRRKRNRRQRSAEEQADFDYNEEHSAKFVSELAKKDSQYNWMKDDKNKRMFQKIEKRIQGAMGSGTYDWVDRRVFDQVFDRLTLMSLYKLMNAGVLDTLDFPVARGKEAHVFHGTDQQGKSVAVKIFHTSNAVFKNLMQYIEGDPRFGGLRRRHRDASIRPNESKQRASRVPEMRPVCFRFCLGREHYRVQRAPRGAGAGP